MTTTNINALQQLIQSQGTSPPRTSSGNFFEALAKAWGEALDKQADVIQEKSEALNQDGNDTPGAVTQLSAEAARLTFMATSSSTSLQNAGEALKTVAK